MIPQQLFAKPATNKYGFWMTDFGNNMVPSHGKSSPMPMKVPSNTPGGKCTMDAALIFIAVAWGLSRHTNTRQKGQ